ncbi:hypothetical protein EsDP_00001047 [Epichloe bromicola]|uniref:ATP-dependent DNA ligase family profile domain-containing protein n=1 Tax=Epichloe bromicola TaxID=79588 RepID=A0ABQ0CGP8_9HYPO
MPIPFALVCDLLDDCEQLYKAKKPNTKAITQWFTQNRTCIDSYDTDLAALLSTLLPEKRTDRVYCIKTPTLEKLIGKALMLGASRLVELGLCKRPDQRVDLAECVERILTATVGLLSQSILAVQKKKKKKEEEEEEKLITLQPNPSHSQHRQITVEEIDQVLHDIASRIVWSSPSIRSHRGVSTTPRGRNDLQDVYRRLSAREAKWFTRLVLKDYKPLILDSGLVYKCCDPNLPLVLKVQDDFATAIKTLQALRSGMATDSARSAAPWEKIVASVEPKLGIKVGRQNWFKGRSIKHCLDMGHGRMSVEDKIDGEYCQIHVSVLNGKLKIQIFSKSGKDSTEDRHKLNGIIADSIRYGRSDCTVRQGCILEGELVVHDDVENKIMPFHKIRNHVARRGRLMNVDLDSPPRSYENLMIVYYDILFLDQRSLLDVRHSERFRILEKTIRCERGRAELVKRTLVDFHRPTGASELRKAFARVIAAKGEGLVLKPDEPYFDFHKRKEQSSGHCIKLKKEYIGTFGDVGDFAVVGAGFNPSKARCYKIANLRWTVFYLGCLNNKEEVKRWGATPEFTVVSAVEITEPLLKMFIVHGNPVSVPLASNFMTKLHVPKVIEADTPLTVAFPSPPVFDLRCFSFDKPGNMGFWTLRFPVVSKIHFDRDFSDSVTFKELQEMARKARATPDLGDSQENLQWIAKLEGADPRGLAVDALSQSTTTTMPAPSPPSSRTSLSPVWGGRSISPGMSRTYSGGQHSASVSTTWLPTPPTSSPPEPEPDLDSSGGQETPHSDGKRKSLADPPQAASPSPKRRAHTVARSPTAAATRTPRKPLQHVDGNASRNTTPTHLSFAGTGTGTGTVGGENQPAISCAVPETRGVNDSQGLPSEKPVGHHGAALHCAQIPILPSSEEEASQPTQKTYPTKQASKGECTFAGEKCHMFGSTVLLASSALVESAERAALLEAHGVAKTAVDMSEWLEANNFGATLGNKSPSIIILVDTVKRGRETEKVLASVELTRRELPGKTRGWIAVYDWRVLGHLKVMEDTNTKEKYYDGFQDPWRRWYCGIV